MSCLAAAAVLASTSPCLADEEPDAPRGVVGVHGNYVTGGDDGERGDGGGIGLRLGSHDTALWGAVAVFEEVVGSYSHVLDRHVGRVAGGAGMGLQFIVIGVYGHGHVGYGFGAPGDGITFDLGVSASLLLFDDVRPGLHLEYVHIFDELKMLTAGVRVDFML